MQNTIKNPEFFPSSLLRFQHESSEYEATVLNCGHEVYEPAREVPRDYDKSGHSHDVYHAVLYTQGNFTFFLNDRFHTFRPGTFVFTNPRDMHCFGPYFEPMTIAYRQVTFCIQSRDEKHTRLRLDFDKVLRDHAGLDIKPVEFPINLSRPQMVHIESLYETMTSTMARRDGLSHMRCLRALTGLFLFLVEDIYCGRIISTPVEQDKLQMAREQIDACFAQKLNVDDLAGISGLSKRSFYQRFKARYNISPIAYQKMLRMHASKSLLQSSGLPIGEIAIRCGFCDIYHFSRIFKEETGVSPRRFRQEYSAISV
jgi:AraC-like DNA-binding protein